MDSLTQITLGAAVGQAAGYGKLGKRAVWIGALGGLIPDLDVLYLRFLGPYAVWLYHRHVTHSLLFAPVVIIALEILLWIWMRRVARLRPETASPVFLVLFLALFTHPLLDLFTIYGTQLLAPFDATRFAISSVAIIDPAYTLPLTAALVFAFVPRLQRLAVPAAVTALILSTAYLFYGWAQNTKAEEIARAQLAKDGITAADVRAYTTMFQPYLRRIVARSDADELRVGFVSTWGPQPIVWSCQPQAPQKWKDAILATEGGRILNWFAGSDLSVTEQKTSLPNQKRIRAMTAKYGYPGDSLFGLWGLEWILTLDETGAVQTISDPVDIYESRDASLESIKGLFRASYGLPNDFLPDKSTCR
jgi:inner membrane protein